MADAVEIARRISSGEISAREAVDAAIARAQGVDPVLNAIATPLFDSARARAERGLKGVFAGVPSFIKDTDAVAGAPMLYGSRALPATPARRSSAFVKQFLSLGLISLGKTTLPEFGLTGTTESLAHGPTHNPWRSGFSPGGSSGGSAALVAAGVVPLAHANDGGGSIRIPAACCGLVGLKPSRGRVAEVSGARLLPVRIVHQGILSRTVRDTAAFFHGVEQGFRRRELTEIGLVHGPGRRLRIGYFTEYDGQGDPTHADCAKAATDAVSLCESLGHSVEPVRCPFDEAFLRDFFLLWAAMAFATTRLGKWIIHRDMDRTRVEPFTEGLAQYCAENARRVPGSIWRLRRFARHYARGFGQCDVLLCPTLATPPPEHGYLGPEVPLETLAERMKSFIPFTPAYNVSGAPALSLPLGKSGDGLPVGVQFGALLGQERTLLELALELEAAAPWPTLA